MDLSDSKLNLRYVHVSSFDPQAVPFRQFETLEQLLEEMPKSIGSGPDDGIFITMVRGYGRSRMRREVTRVLDLLPKFGKVSSLKLLNSVLDVLAKEDNDIAREFYGKKMMGSGLKGDN